MPAARDQIVTVVLQFTVTGGAVPASEAVRLVEEKVAASLAVRPRTASCRISAASVTSVTATPA